MITAFMIIHSHDTLTVEAKKIYWSRNCDIK
jgi:hypothetical protein